MLDDARFYYFIITMISSRIYNGVLTLKKPHLLGVNAKTNFLDNTKMK